MTSRWFVAYSFLLLAVHEAHELAHAITGRLLCGEWPVRDFNSWHFAGECATWLPSAAGPAFSYLLMLVGAILTLRSGSRWAGVSLLFGANPFARIFTALMGGGDEMVVAQSIAELPTRTTLLKISVAVFVLSICGAAIAAGWRALAGLKRRALWFAVVLLWPMLVTGVQFVIGNRLLHAGVFDSPTITGAPLLVVVVSAVSVVLAVLTSPSLFKVSLTTPAVPPRHRS